APALAPRPAAAGDGGGGVHRLRGGVVALRLPRLARLRDRQPHLRGDRRGQAEALMRGKESSVSVMGSASALCASRRGSRMTPPVGARSPPCWGTVSRPCP